MSQFIQFYTVLCDNNKQLFFAECKFMVNKMMIGREMQVLHRNTVEALKSGDMDGDEDQRKGSMYKSILQNTKNGPRWILEKKTLIS